MRRLNILVCLLLAIFVSASSVFAQEATPAATPEPMSEVTPEATPEAMSEPLTSSEIFAELPQTRLEDGGFVVGEPDAPITIVEFADYACPHCQNYRPVIEQVIADYVATGQAKFELRIFPTAGGQLTYYVGQLVECAEHQREGAFWAAYDTLYDYATSGEYTPDVGHLLAKDLDVNYAKMLVCAQDASQVLTDITYGQDHGVTGTPAVMVRYDDGEVQFITLDGVTYDRGGVSYDVLATVIEQANGGVVPTEEPTAQVVIWNAPAPVNN